MKSQTLLRAIAALSLLLPTTGCAGLMQRASSADAATASRPGATVELPAPERVVLPNGLTLLVIERRNLPIVSVSAVVRGGSALDPANKPGLASLTAELLRRGTQKRTAPQIAQAIDFVGGSLSSGSGADSSSAGVSVLRKDLDLGLELLSDVLLRPTFPDAELKRLKEEAEAALTSSLDDPNSVLGMAFTREVLQGHPYGRGSTLSGLKAIDRTDVKRHYETYYRPNNTFMAVVGDISAEEVRAKFAQHFGAWQRKAVPDTALEAPGRTAGKQVVLVDMPVNQSFIRLGHVGVKRNNPDYFPLLVLNFILGGDFTSRLNQSIRDRQGLAYGAGSRFAMSQYGGTFSASLNTKAESTGQAVKSLLAEINAVQREGITAEELTFAKNYLTGSFPLRFETNSDLAGEVVNMEFFGLPADYLSTYRERVRAVTAEDVKRVAQKYLQPDEYDLVVVAKAKDVEPVLKAFGTLRRVDRMSLVK